MIKVSDFQRDWEKLRERHVFLACSGGVDSMALLHLLKIFTDKLTVLHINYQLRGADSDADEALVREACAASGVPLLTRTFDTRKALEKGGNLQDIARKFRYDWFRELLAQDKQNCIVLGHHRDDQVETFFQHLARKSGIMGMAGMLEDHAGIVRPLLKYTKQEIYAFAQANKIAWREDLSNTESAYTRNKLRNLILPALEKEIPELSASVMVLVQAFQQTQQEIEKKVMPVAEAIAATGNWPLEDFDSRSGEEKAEVLRKLGIRQPFIAEIEKIRFSQKGKKLFVGDYEITREKDALHFELRNGKVQALSQTLNIQPVASLPEIFDKNVLYLDAGKIQGDLQLRTWQLGDRMKPAGLKGSKLISDILKDAKLPAHAKKHVQVVTDDVRILWCVGICVSSEGIATASSSEILKVELTQDFWT